MKAHETTSADKLSGDIMNIQVHSKLSRKAVDECFKSCRTVSEIAHAAYLRGHRDARHEAAELVLLEMRKGDHHDPI